jgi:hypothetical protein
MRAESVRYDETVSPSPAGLQPTVYFDWNCQWDSSCGQRMKFRRRLVDVPGLPLTLQIHLPGPVDAITPLSWWRCKRGYDYQK